jgi:hypothetical protein
VGNKSSNQVGDPKAPSSGGQGETIPQQVISRHRAKIEVSVAKAVYAANTYIGGLIYSVREGGNNLEAWEKSFDSAVVGKSQADLVTESVITDAYNALVDVLDRAEWVDTVSNDVAGIVSANELSRVKSRMEEEFKRRAEAEFIDGVREDIALTDEEMLELSALSKSSQFLEAKSALLKLLVPKIILVAKSGILGYKYPIDTKDKTDNNNLKLAKSIAESVYQLLPQTLEEVQNELSKLGDN